MSLHRKNIFLTLVVLIFLSLFCSPLYCYSIPSSDIPPDKIDTGLSKPNSENDSHPLIATRKLTRDLNFSGMGIWSGYTSSSNTNESVYFLSIGKRLDEDLESSTEASIKLLFNGVAGWFYGKKWLYELGYMQEPYYKLGVGALYSFSENIATFINWNRYYVSGSIGFDDLFNLDRRWRSDLGFSYSSLGLGFYLGFEFAF